MRTPVVLISGAAGNLGAAVCERFLTGGYEVLALDSHRSAAKTSGIEGVNSFPVDLGSEKEIAEVMRNIDAGYNGISSAVMTVGGFSMGTIAETGPSEIEKMIRLNFISAYNLTRELLDRMQEGGQLVFIGSGPAIHPESAAPMIAYGLSKSLLVYLARVINESMAKKKLSASVIIPGVIDTPRNREAMPGADFSAWQTPGEIAGRIFRLHTSEGRSERGRIIEI